MTELSFLIDLLLYHKLGTETKQLIMERIKTVEQALQDKPLSKPINIYQGVVPAGPQQAPSTLAAMARHNNDPELAAASAVARLIEVPPAPVAVIAQTPATTAAMNSRQQAINESLAGKVDKNTGRPRKF